MGASDSKSLQGFGFLTAVEDQQLGWIGGYLVLNAAGRPLEFHCTAPVKPNRAQQILYGPTLACYICGEQIGTALTRKSSINAAAIFTNTSTMMAVRCSVNSPVACVNESAEAIEDNTSVATSNKQVRIDAPHETPRPASADQLISFQVGGINLSVAEAFAADQQRIAALLEDPSGLDLHEPFQRILEAIEETQLRKR